MDDPVQEQYEAYPYPARDPAEEDRRLIVGSPSQLDEVNHYLFAGQRDFGAGFRALVAGGGTGDGTIMLAQQLAERGSGDVVYLDLSKKAREVAEARAERRNLTNVTFVTGPLEAIGKLAPGPFDYIDCCGVLHHLTDPATGLKALTDVLAPGGGLGIMLYAPYGRTGVYGMQAMLRDLAGPGSLEDKVALARRLNDALPRTNWLKRNPFLGDHKRSDAELVDLFLHARDRAYTVNEFYDFAAAADLDVISFIEAARYDPASYLEDPILLESLAPLDERARTAFAETLAGNIKKHIAYLAPKGSGHERRATAERATTRPILGRAQGRQLAQAFDQGGHLSVDMDGIPLRLSLPALAPEILTLVDGTRSLARIHEALQQRHPNLDWLAFKSAFEEIFRALESVNLMWLAEP